MYPFINTYNLLYINYIGNESDAKKADAGAGATTEYQFRGGMGRGKTAQ